MASSASVSHNSWSKRQQLFPRKTSFLKAVDPTLELAGKFDLRFLEARSSMPVARAGFDRCSSILRTAATPRPYGPGRSVWLFWPDFRAPNCRALPETSLRHLITRQLPLQRAAKRSLKVSSGERRRARTALSCLLADAVVEQERDGLCASQSKVSYSHSFPASGCFSVSLLLLHHACVCA